MKVSRSWLPRNRRFARSAGRVDQSPLSRLFPATASAGIHGSGRRYTHDCDAAVLASARPGLPRSPPLAPVSPLARRAQAPARSRRGPEGGRPRPAVRRGHRAHAVAADARPGRRADRRPAARQLGLHHHEHSGVQRLHAAEAVAVTAHRYPASGRAPLSRPLATPRPLRPLRRRYAPRTSVTLALFHIATHAPRLSTSRLMSRLHSGGGAHGEPGVEFAEPLRSRRSRGRRERSRETYGGMPACSTRPPGGTH
jgi:hypothetical protein